MRRVVALVFVVGLSAPLSACGSSSPSPQAVRASIVAAALAQKSVHYERDDEVEFDATYSVTADVAADSGIARLDSDTTEIRLVNNTLYVRGDFDALGLNVPQGKSQWISIPRGDTLDAHAALSYVTLSGIFENIPRRVRLGAVANRLPGYVAWVDHYLGDTTDSDARFSKWNEPVHVQVPANAVLIATVRGG